jgi:arsenate reductase
MKIITMYHNPRCSKSREALALAEQYAASNAARLDVVDYQKTPLTFDQLKQLQGLLGVPAAEMVRTADEAYAALGLTAPDDDALLQAVAAHPALLQRPIVVLGERAAIGRPPERIAALLQGA